MSELAEGARLEIVCALTPHREFESLPLRHCRMCKPPETGAFSILSLSFALHPTLVRDRILKNNEKTLDTFQRFSLLTFSMHSSTIFLTTNFYFGFFYFWRGLACGQREAVHPK